MKAFEEYLPLAEKAHGHLCAGQVLGVRLALRGLLELGIEDPIAERKRLLVFVEIDRCATDAISLVTGCRLGRRALKFVDYGKMAATFVDLKTGRAVRIIALDESKNLACEMFPNLEKREQQFRAYQVLPEEKLFRVEKVRVRLREEDLPGYSRERVACAECGEGISYRREVIQNGRVLCRACAGERYYEKI